MRLSILFCLASSLALAGDWEGVLVNTKCYDDVERNVSPWESGVYGARNRNYEIRYCRANGKTSAFTVVQPDGRSYKLDPQGNTRAAEIVRGGNQRNMFVVAVAGQLTKDTIQVDLMSLLRNPPPR